MAKRLSELRSQINALAQEEKEQLLTELMVELDGPIDEEIEKAWIQEAHRRLAELDSGKVKAIPAEEVFARLRAEWPS